jgi:hypothetical protein
VETLNHSPHINVQNAADVNAWPQLPVRKNLTRKQIAPARLTPAASAAVGIPASLRDSSGSAASIEHATTEANNNAHAQTHSHPCACLNAVPAR